MYAGGTIHRSERYRGGDPAVQACWSIFVAGELLPHELPPREEPPVFEHQPHVTIQELGIPGYRQVRCMVDVAAPKQWAPGSLGEKFGYPPAFGRALLVKDRVYDVLDDRVRQNPGWFRWCEREVTAEDVERLEREGAAKKDEPE